MHDSYGMCGTQTCTQLQAAVNFITAHPRQVNPVTLDIGGNDITNNGYSNLTLDRNICAVDNTLGDPASWQSVISQLDTDLTQRNSNGILYQLTQVLGTTGNLIILNYYDYFNPQYPPPANENPPPACPNFTAYIQALNQHIANDAALFNVPVVDIWSTLGPTTICSDTNWCTLQDLHPNTLGYTAMAQKIEALYGY